MIDRVSVVVSRNEEKAEMVEIKQGRRRTENHNKIPTWYRVIVSTKEFCRKVAVAMDDHAFVLPEDQSTELKLWVPKVYYPSTIIPFKRGFKPLRSDPLGLESTVGLFTRTPTPSSPLPPASQTIAESSAAPAFRKAQQLGSHTRFPFVLADIDREILDIDINHPSDNGAGEAQSGESVDIDFTLDNDDEPGSAGSLVYIDQDGHTVIDLTAETDEDEMEEVLEMEEVVDLTLDEVMDM